MFRFICGLWITIIALIAYAMWDSGAEYDLDKTPEEDDEN